VLQPAANTVVMAVWHTFFYLKRTKQPLQSAAGDHKTNNPATSNFKIVQQMQLAKG